MNFHNRKRRQNMPVDDGEGSDTAKSTGSENLDNARVSSDERNDDDNMQQIKRASTAGRKKPYQRHTRIQTQQMDAFFKECPHPDERQRGELSRSLGLEPLQVKFWFQNKRTQIKAQHERHENTSLRSENERLREENKKLKESLRNALCPSCTGGGGGREEGSVASTTPAGGGGRLRSIGKPVIVEVASSGMEELLRMTGQLDEQQLWIGGGGIDTLNEGAYAHGLCVSRGGGARGLGPKLAGFKTEATRDSAVVPIGPYDLVGILMDVDKWSAFFSCIISKAATIEEVFSTGVANDYNGAMQVMSAELQLPTPVVATRSSTFVRYCKQLQPDGRTWAIVDVSLDGLRPGGPELMVRRRPSGCIIQHAPPPHLGFSKVTWVEHVEVSEKVLVHEMYKKVVETGMAFGARRWVSSLQRQCERLAVATSNHDFSRLGGEGKRCLLRLAERMVKLFYGSVSSAAAAGGGSWTCLAQGGRRRGDGGGDTTRVMMATSGGGGMNDLAGGRRRGGVFLCATASFSLPAASPATVFHFLCSSRCKWDILCDGVLKKIASVQIGENPGNHVSLLNLSERSAGEEDILILEECCTDAAAGAHVVYAPVNIAAVVSMLNGGLHPEGVALLPSGFSILSDVVVANGDFGGSSTLLTASFQILAEAAPAPTSMCAQKLPDDSSVSAIVGLVESTVERIKLSCCNS